MISRKCTFIVVERMEITMQENRWVLEEVKRAGEQGIPVDIDGRACHYRETEKIIRVLQRNSYMLDYEGDALGRIIALHIDSVETHEKPSYKSLRCKKNKAGKGRLPENGSPNTGASG